MPSQPQLRLGGAAVLAALTACAPPPPLEDQTCWLPLEAMAPDGAVAPLEGPHQEEPFLPPLGPDGRILAPELEQIRLMPLPERPPLPAAIVNSGPRDRPLVALTFDACSSAKVRPFDVAIVEALLEHDVAATFFLGGYWMLRHAEDTLALAAIPQFELAIHGYAHAHMQRLPAEVIREDLRTNQQILVSLTGRPADFFRPPFGEYSPRLLDVCSELGVLPVNFDLAAGDSDPTISAKRLARHIIDNVRPGSIVVLHANGLGKHTAAVLPEVITGLRARGLELVTVGQLLADEPPRVNRCCLPPTRAAASSR